MELLQTEFNQEKEKLKKSTHEVGTLEEKNKKFELKIQKINKELEEEKKGANEKIDVLKKQVLDMEKDLDNNNNESEESKKEF